MAVLKLVEAHPPLKPIDEEGRWECVCQDYKAELGFKLVEFGLECIVFPQDSEGDLIFYGEPVGLLWDRGDVVERCGSGGDTVSRVLHNVRSQSLLNLL